MSALARGLPSGLISGTTSVLMASATTSWMTDPVTAMSEATTKSRSTGSTVIQPPAAPASSTKLTAIRPAPDEHVGAPLRSQQRNGVDQLAEHHLHRPRQAEPDRQGGQLGRRPGERLLDPERLGDGGQPHGAVGEVDHQQRQILEAHGAHGRQQGVLDLLLPVVGMGGACGFHLWSGLVGTRANMAAGCCRGKTGGLRPGDHSQRRARIGSARSARSTQAVPAQPLGSPPARRTCAQQSPFPAHLRRVARLGVPGPSSRTGEQAVGNMRRSRRAGADAGAWPRSAA